MRPKGAAAAVEMLVSYKTLARYPGAGVFHSYEGICKHVNRHETDPSYCLFKSSMQTQRRALLRPHTHRLDDGRRREASQRCIRINSSREVSRRCRQMARWRPESLSSPWLNAPARAKRWPLAPRRQRARSEAPSLRRRRARAPNNALAPRKTNARSRRNNTALTPSPRAPKITRIFPYAAPTAARPPP